MTRQRTNKQAAATPPPAPPPDPPPAPEPNTDPPSVAQAVDARIAYSLTQAETTSSDPDEAEVAPPVDPPPPVPAAKPRPALPRLVRFGGSPMVESAGGEMQQPQSCNFETLGPLIERCADPQCLRQLRNANLDFASQLAVSRRLDALAAEGIS